MTRGGASSSAGIKHRPGLGLLYSDVAAIDWELSGHVLRPPTVVAGKFVHLAPPAVLKWTARARSGALATRARLFKNKQSPSAQCPGCGHVLTGYPETGSADCAVFASQLWTTVGQGRGAELLPLPATWVYSHLLRLSVGFIPRSLLDFIPPQVNWLSRTFLKDFHMGMVARLAEVLRRRECLISAQSNQTASSSTGARPSSSTVDAARTLTVADLRQAERASLPPSALAQAVRRTYKGAFVATREAATSRRHRHLRETAVAQGGSSVALLLLWEADHGIMFPSRMAEMKQRLGAFTKNLLDAVVADSELSKWVEVGRSGSTRRWSTSSSLLGCRSTT